MVRVRVEPKARLHSTVQQRVECRLILLVKDTVRVCRREESRVKGVPGDEPRVQVQVSAKVVVQQ